MIRFDPVKNTAGQAEKTGWATVQTQRSVLVAVHNITAMTRLLDVLPLIGGDPRIQIRFVVTGSSAFTAGTCEFLKSIGVIPLDWDDAKVKGADVVITASHGGDLGDLGAPVLILPHGVGYNKYLPRSSGKPVFGLSSDWLFDEDGKIIPSALVLSHTEQLDRLIAACAPAAPVAVLAGDPCLDRMLASLPLRNSYRSAFCVGERIMVVVSSTWGEKSLYGENPGFVTDLVLRLPADEFLVVMVMHPNIAAWHSPWQVRMWMEECERVGVVVLDPIEGWRAALVAADVVIGDHGSVTLYATALGRPVGLAVVPDDAVDPASAMGVLLDTAPRFVISQNPAMDLVNVIKDAGRVGLAPAGALVSSAPGESATLLRTLLYQMMDLSEPEHQADYAVLPVPRLNCSGTYSHLVTVTIINYSTKVLEAEVVRYPVSHLARQVPLAPGHLVVSLQTPYKHWLDRAEIIAIDVDPRGDTDRLLEAKAVLAELPTCSLTLVTEHGTWLVASRDWLVRVSYTSESKRSDRNAGLWCASILCEWMRDGRRPIDIPPLLHLWVGGGLHTLIISSRSGYGD